VATLTRHHMMTLRRARLAKYLAPQVVDLMMKRSGCDRLEGTPRVLEATTLFFDLRGFSLSTEAPAEQLLGQHGDRQRIMSVVTDEVFAAGGTVLDFQGDGNFKCNLGACSGDFNDGRWSSLPVAHRPVASCEIYNATGAVETRLSLVVNGELVTVLDTDPTP